MQRRDRQGAASSERADWDAAENQPLRAGVCYTSTTLIHLRSIDANDPAPDGWSGPIAPVNLGNGVTYVTYWLLTPR